MMSHEEFISLRRNSIDFEMFRLVERALQRIDTGQYGICQECDERISEKRLLVLPWAHFCFRCQDRVGELAMAGNSGRRMASSPAYW